MSDNKCPNCGATNEPNAAFCGTCGTPLATQSPNTSSNQPAPGAPQPPASNQPQSPATFAPPPPGAIPAPPGVYPPPPGVYPPMGPGGVTGQNTKWAIGLGIAALFCCGPFTAIPGLFLAKNDMDAFASGRAPHLNESSAKLAFYLNVIALILSVIGILFFWGRGFRAF